MDWTTTLLLSLSYLFVAQATGPPAQEKPAGRIPPSRLYVIFNSPHDENELWQKIESPDLLVIKPSQNEAGGHRNSVGGNEGGEVGLPAAIQSIAISGQVLAEHADLRALMTIVLTGPEAVWVPIRLDDQRLTSAREGNRELLLRAGEHGRWQVQLAGPGPHQIEVKFRASVKSEPARHWLSVPIVEAASTRVALDFVANETDIVVGSNEDYGVSDLGEGKPKRLSAHLSPRSKLEVSWSGSQRTAQAGSPLLTAQGEIAIDIDADQMRTRSSWMIRSVRGMTRELQIGLGDDDEPTELLVDDQPIESGVERAAGELTIPLGEQLRPGKAKHVVLKTRRSLKNPAARAIFSGFPVKGASDQTGFIGVIQSPNLWISAVPLRGTRQIDPRELPTDLRARPSTNLAFEFREQPFQLELLVEPLPPLVRAESKTVFRIDSQQARSETTIDLSWVRGRLYDLELEVPAGLQDVTIDQADVVEHSSLTSAKTDGSPGQSPKILKVRLTPAARDQNTVTLKVRASEPIPPAGLAKLGLITPIHATSVAARYELVADSGLVLELDDESGRIRRSKQSGAASIRSQSRGSSWRGARDEGVYHPLLFTSDGNVKELPVRIKRHNRTISHETEVAAQVSKRSIDVIQHSHVVVHFGALAALEIRVPAAIADRWELIDKDLAQQQELGLDQDGSRRYRLAFERAVVDKVLLRFRYRLPIAPSLDSNKSREIILPRITIREGRAAPARVRLSLASEIVLEAADPSWTRLAQDSTLPTGEHEPVVTFAQDAPDRDSQPFSFRALACETVPMPPTLVGRLLIKTALTEEGSHDRVFCWVESHGTGLAFSIPPGARWLGARVDGRIIDQVDYDPAQFRYRLRFPADVGPRPALVEFDYQSAARDGKGRLQPPRLLDGAVVLQSIWEVRVSGNQAVLGVPPGWFDENQWYWDGYVSKQGPAKNSASLRSWLVGSALAPSISAIDDFDESRFDEAHRSAFVFSRSGEPIALAISIVPRSFLVALCSGITLFLGFLAIFSRAQFRTIWMGLALLGLLAAMFLQTSVLFLVLQSAVIGLALTVLGLAIRTLIERSRGVPLGARDSSLLAVRPPADSSLNRTPAVGSDDSTAIRVRVPSTLDFVPAAAAESPLSE